ncbi:MAG: hypothetical protein KAT00_05750 [Planctomycetes bacterium]|nr:hypothetical protein [Planctomycetota bacterium]
MTMIKKTAEWIRNMLTTRRQAYCQIFSGVYGERVLADLARFCRATESTFNKDPQLASKLDGRREVFLRIQKHLNLSDQELWKLFEVDE